jgi:hypothetical protein
MCFSIGFKVSKPGFTFVFPLRACTTTIDSERPNTPRSQLHGTSYRTAVRKRSIYIVSLKYVCQVGFATSDTRAHTSAASTTSRRHRGVRMRREIDAYSSIFRPDIYAGVSCYSDACASISYRNAYDRGATSCTTHAAACMYQECHDCAHRTKRVGAHDCRRSRARRTRTRSRIARNHTAWRSDGWRRRRRRLVRYAHVFKPSDTVHRIQLRQAFMDMLDASKSSSS